MVADVTPPDSGSIRVATTEAGWLRIPADVPAHEHEAWVEVAAAGLRDAWGENWDERAELVVPVMLRTSLEDRPDEHMVFEVWPVFYPVRARVRISIVDPGTLPDWRADGFEIIGYDDAPIGPGITCVRIRESIEGEATVSLVDWCSVFSDGDRAVVVLVDTVPLDFFVLLQPGLHGLISTMRVTDPGGEDFQARPSEYAIVDDEAIWSTLRMRDEGLMASDSPTEQPSGRERDTQDE